MKNKYYLLFLSFLITLSFSGSAVEKNPETRSVVNLVLKDKVFTAEELIARGRNYLKENKGIKNSEVLKCSIWVKPNGNTLKITLDFYAELGEMSYSLEIDENGEISKYTSGILLG